MKHNYPVDVTKAIIILCTCWWCCGPSTLLLLIAADGLFPAADAILELLANIRVTDEFVYSAGILFRYSLYLTIWLLIVGIELLLWCHISLLHICALLMTAPPILNYITSYPRIISSITSIELYIRSYLLKSASSIVAAFVNSVGASMDINPGVTYNEIYHAAAASDEAALIWFAKAAVAAVTIRYIQHSRIGGVLQILRVVTVPNRQRGIDTVKQILAERKWSELLKPAVINDIIEIYKTDRQSAIRKWIILRIKKLEVQIIKFFAVYAVSSVVGVWIVAPLSAALLIIPIISRRGMQALVNIPAAALLSRSAVALYIYYFNVGSGSLTGFAASICSEFAEYIDCKLTRAGIERIYSYRMKISDKVINLSALCCVFAAARPLFSIPAMISVAGDKRAATWLCIGMISGWHPCHLIVLAVAYYIWDGINGGPPIEQPRPAATRPIKPARVITDYFAEKICRVGSMESLADNPLMGSIMAATT